jgi:hypothetical protein
MAVTVRLDLVDGASVDSARTGGNQIIRVAYVSGLTAGVAASILDSAIKAPGMPQKGEPHPSDANLARRPLQRPARRPERRLRPDLLRGAEPRRRARRAAGRPGHDDLHAGDDQPPPAHAGAAAGLPGPPRGINKILQASFGLPMRTVVLYGLFTDPRPATWKLGVGCVNMKRFLDYDPGFWLCTYYDEQWSDSDNKHRVTVSFSSKQIYDWSTYAQMRGPTGEFIDVDDAQYKIIVQQKYDYDTIWHTDGVGRWGFYPFCDFAALYNAFTDL